MWWFLFITLLGSVPGLDYLWLALLHHWDLGWMWFDHHGRFVVMSAPLTSSCAWRFSPVNTSVMALLHASHEPESNDRRGTADHNVKPRHAPNTFTPPVYFHGTVHYFLGIGMLMPNLKALWKHIVEKICKRAWWWTTDRNRAWFLRLVPVQIRLLCLYEKNIYELKEEITTIKNIILM